MYMYRAPVLCKLLCRGYAAEGTRRQTLYYVNYYVAGTRRTVRSDTQTAAQWVQRVVRQKVTVKNMRI